MRYIFIHGLGQTPDSWNQVVFQLNASTSSLCPNLAELLAGKKATYQNLYSSFSKLCNELDHRVSLCGLSLGGVLALHYAIDHPEKVESLVLTAAQYKMPKKRLRFQNALFRFMPKSMFQQMGFGKESFLTLCSTMMALDFTESLQKVSCPTLLVCGEKDRADKRASMELEKRLSHATFKSIDGAGHEVNVESPEELAKAIATTFA